MRENSADVKILIVEDERIIAKDLQATLESAGYSIPAIADSYQRAMDIARDVKPDLVLMDIYLKGAKNGIEAAEAIRIAWNIPVIYLTAYADEEILAEAKITEPYGYIIKPFQDRELISVIEIALYKSRMEKRVRDLNAILRAISLVNQLIVQEKNPSRLLEGTMQALAKPSSILCAWVALYDSEENLSITASSGNRSAIPEIESLMKAKNYPSCIREALSRKRLVVHSLGNEECIRCPQSKRLGSGTGLARCLELGERVFGVLGINVAKSSEDIEEEKALFEEVAGDLAFALNSIRTEKEQKRVLHSLEESEEKFRALAENAPDTIMRFDRNHRHLYANRVVESLTGIPPEEFINKTHEELGFPEDLCRLWGEAIDTVFDTAVNHRVEFQLPNGIWMDWLLSPEFDADGRVRAVMTSSRDITERKAMERRFQLATEATSDLIYEWNLADDDLQWFWDIDGNLGYEPGTISRTLKGWEKIVHPDELPKISEILDRHRTIAEPINMKYRMRHADGSWRHWIEHGLPVVDNDGKPIMYIGSCKDVTEKVNIESQLQQAQKMEAVGRLAGGIAHDFNNLLTTITGHLSLAQLDMADDHPLKDTLDEIQGAANRAADLTFQLLAFSRKQIIEPKVINLNDLIRKMQTMLVRLIGEDVELKIFPQKRLGRVKADPGQMEQIVMNLAVNARDAMPNGGRLLIETADTFLDDEMGRARPLLGPGRYVCLSVSDTGHGMDENTRQKIFEPFFTTKEEGHGTGLGLSTVFGIVRQHKGIVQVYTEPGIGTTFKIYLPKVMDKAEPIPESPGQAEIRKGTETILVVEDEDMVRSIAIKILRRMGYKVLEAASGTEALKIAKKAGRTPIDLLMTDLVMPIMNGRELAEELLKVFPAMKILYTSGYTENIIAHHGVLDEGLNFIGKPYTSDTLAMKIREILDTDAD